MDRKVEGTIHTISDGGVLTNTITGRKTKGHKNKHGYLMFKLGREGKTVGVHSLVAYAFPEICGNHFEGAQVDHINGDKTDNRACNLRWVTAKENCNNPATLQKLSRPVLQFTKEGIYEADYPSYSAVSKAFDKSSNYSVWKVLNHYNRNKSYQGKVFKYRDEGYYDFWVLMKKTAITESAFRVIELSAKNDNELYLQRKMVSRITNQQN